MHSRLQTCSVTADLRTSKASYPYTYNVLVIKQPNVSIPPHLHVLYRQRDPIDQYLYATKSTLRQHDSTLWSLYTHTVPSAPKPPYFHATIPATHVHIFIPPTPPVRTHSAQLCYTMSHTSTSLHLQCQSIDLISNPPHRNNYSTTSSLNISKVQVAHLKCSSTSP